MEALKRILRRMFCQHDYVIEAEVVARDTDSGITERTLFCCCKKCGKPNQFFYKDILSN